MPKKKVLKPRSAEQPINYNAWSPEELAAYIEKKANGEHEKKSACKKKAPRKKQKKDP